MHCFHKVTDPLLILCIIFTVLFDSCKCVRFPCNTGQYFDEKSNSCIKCSSCRDNEVVRRTCGGISDTVCGPFYEFKSFLKNNNKHFEQPMSVSKELRTDVKEDTWYIVTLVMIGCLCISSVILVVLVVVLVSIYRKRVKKREFSTSEEGREAVLGRFIFQRDHSLQLEFCSADTFFNC